MDPPSNSRTGKRKASATDRPISPPPVKRKAVQSTISKGAVASFFTPTSQKPKDRTVWSERAPEQLEHDGGGEATLLVGRFEPEEKVEEGGTIRRRKIAAFDFDSTLIVTSSGKKFGNDPGDWKWWDPCVPARLRRMYKEEGYRIVILSNQGGLTLHADPKSKGPKNAPKARVSNFKQKCAAVLQQLNLPTTVYAATARDEYRKPRTGMWREVCRDYDIAESEVDLENSVFIGDAGGRVARLATGATGGSGSGNASAVAKDFSCSDRNFAANVGVRYTTPEEFFLGEPPREFMRDFDLEKYPYPEHQDGKEVLFEKRNKHDVVLFCGPPGAGKSTFFWKFLKPLGYERVNQDTLKSRAKCLKAAAELLDEGCSVVIDNTNPDVEGRKEYIDLAKKYDIPIRCVWFKIPKALCEHNDAVRAMNKSLNPESRTSLPPLAFNGYFARLREPTTKEGFQDILPVEFRFRGTREEYAIWARYWT